MCNHILNIRSISVATRALEHSTLLRSFRRRLLWNGMKSNTLWQRGMFCWWMWHIPFSSVFIIPFKRAPNCTLCWTMSMVESCSFIFRGREFSPSQDQGEVICGQCAVYVEYTRTCNVYKSCTIHTQYTSVILQHNSSRMTIHTWGSNTLWWTCSVSECWGGGTVEWDKKHMGASHEVSARVLLNAQ